MLRFGATEIRGRGKKPSFWQKLGFPLRFALFLYEPYKKVTETKEVRNVNGGTGIVF